MIYFNIGDLRFTSAISVMQNYGSLRYWIIGLLVFGFGIKAGMAPVHVWLPRAHPVAPSPASALLSGVMIKIGAYGILRVATTYYFPSREAVTSLTDPLWDVAQNIGAIIIWTGIITMIIGAFLALAQDNIKKLLAYSSVSQMGYIVLAIGSALYLGYEGPLGYSGAIYHIVNHALFKSLLFMVAGVIYYHTHELNMNKLGGIAKMLPFTTIIFIIATFGIIGLPGFNGYISKTLIHHSLTEAAHLNSNFIFAEILFILTSIITAAYFSKLFYYVFLKKQTKNYKDLVFDISSLDLALLSIALIIIGIGIFPNFILNNLIVPQTLQTTYDPVFITNHILNFTVFNLSDILMSLGIIVSGGIVFILMKKLNLFKLRLPKWLSVEYWFFLPTYLLMRRLCLLLYGDKCPINETDIAKLSDKNIENIGFIDRFVITARVINRRYEQSIIRSDALIYTFFITLTLIILLINRIF
ncbi:MAG: proton-conducting transporter membrane subunit [Candidatus Izemoplasmatales bacterium]